MSSLLLWHRPLAALIFAVLRPYDNEKQRLFAILSEQTPLFAFYADDLLYRFVSPGLVYLAAGQ